MATVANVNKDDEAHLYASVGELHHPLGHRLRQTWSDKMDFVLTAAGLSLGLNNIFRFPYLCYMHGGGEFTTGPLGRLRRSGRPVWQAGEPKLIRGQQIILIHLAFRIRTRQRRPLAFLNSVAFN